MKRLFAILVAVAVAMCSCSKIFDTSVLERNIVELKDRVTALEEQCKQMNTNISSLQTIVTALQNNDYVTGVAPITQNGVEIGYTISFSKSGSITIYHGKDGKDGANGADGKDGTNGTDGKDGVNGADGKDGVTPIIGVKQDTDGIYYWTVNGEWLLDEAGNKVKAVGTDGKDGTNGADGADGKDGVDGTNGTDGKDGVNGTNGTDGITPQLKIENDYWYISYDNGASWTQIGKATGEDGQDGTNGADGAAGKDGDSFFQSIDTSNSDYIIFTLADGTEIKLPTWYAFEQLKTLCNQMNTNLESLQTVVAAMQEGDYITSCTPLMENGRQIGYTIVFAKMGSIIIYHGKDGANGSDGADGSDGSDGSDGAVVVPTIGIKQDTNGIYYWTLDGQWLLDSEGYKVRASPTDGVNGEDGKDGANGSDGADGKDGITPQLKIEEGYWYVSYNNGESWESLGKATGEDGQDGANGADGAAGSDGDSFFQSVTQDENNVIFTLADGTVITVPKSSSYLFNKLQSVSYVPKFNDGKATVYYSAANNSQVEMDFEVSPKDAVEDIAAQWETILSLKAVNTQTRAVTYIDMPILGCTADTQHGVITVTASGKNLAENFFSGEQSVSARLGISDGNTNITSEFIPLVAVPATEPLSNEIWYTSTDGNIVEPYATDVFGANIVSNTYENGKGVILFNGNITEIGESAFAACDNLISITIPNGVTAIGNFAFQSCDNLTGITIPNSVKAIRSYAFTHCKGMQRVTIGEGVETIEHQVFDNCTNLIKFNGKYASEDGRCLIIDGVLNSFAPAGITTYNIPDSVTKIGDYAFLYCSSLTSITIPDSITKIGSFAFSYCFGLTSVTIPDSVTKIGDAAFYYCSSLTSVFCERTTPPTANFEGYSSWNAFDDNATDRKIYVPTDSVDAYKSADGWKEYADAIVADPNIQPNNEIWYTSTDGNIVEPYKTDVFGANIVSNTYENGKGVILFNGNITEIGESAFAACDNLISITIPNGVTAIGNFAFQSCDNLTGITIPNSVKAIRSYAFTHCKGMQRVTIGEGVETIEHQVFDNCTNLIKFNGKYASEDGRCLIIDGVLNSFASAELSEYTISDYVTEIYYSAFSSSDPLTKVVIPDSVEKIGWCAFTACYNLVEVYCRATIPPTIDKFHDTSWNAFSDNATNRKIYVPRASVDAYKSADGWKEYADAIEPYDF